MVLDLRLLSLWRHSETTECDSDNLITSYAAVTDGVRDSDRHYFGGNSCFVLKWQVDIKSTNPTTRSRGQPTPPENDLFIDQMEGAHPRRQTWNLGKFFAPLDCVVDCTSVCPFASGGGQRPETRLDTLPGNREARVESPCARAENTGIPASV